MKKLTVMLLVFGLFCLGGCGLSMNNVDREPSFSGEVLQVHAGYVLVDADNIGGVNVTRQTTIPAGSPDMSVGDRVTVYFDGNIMESYPAQLGEVYAIVVTEKADDSTLYNTVDGFYMEALSTADGSLTVRVVNETDTEYYSGNRHDFSLQKMDENGLWQSVPMLDGEYVNTSEALIFREGGTELVFEWEWRYGELSEGHYRAVKNFWAQDYYSTQLRLTAEFDIG